MMSEVQFLLAPEPGKTLKARCLHVVFLIEEDVHVERRGTCNHLSYKEIDWQYEKCTRSHQKHGDEEVWRIVALIPKIRL